MNSECTVSLCMIVRNEEQNIARCLESVQEAVDEIIVVDTGSADKTVEIARAYGAKVQSFLWNGNFSDARNASLNLATGSWILFLDADESMTAGSAAILREIVAANDVEGYFIKIINYVGTESYSESSPDLVFRLFRNRPGYRFHDAVHEQIVDSIQAHNNQAKFAVAEEVVILHYGYMNQQIEEKDKINRNLSMIVKELAAHPDSLSLHYHYAVELYRSGQFEKSAHEFLAVAQQLEPGALYLAKVIRYIVMAYHGAGRLEEAMAMVGTGLAQFPDYADLHYYGGLLSYETKKYGTAYAFFEKCLLLPEQPVHYASQSGMRGFRPCFYLGQLAEKFCNEEEALRYYIQGLRDNPLFFPILANITRILRPQEDPVYARGSLEKLCDFCSPQAYFIMGQIFFREGAFGLALEYLRKGNDEKREPSLNTIHQAICLLQQEKIPEALEMFNLFPPQDPLYPLALMNQLICFWLQDNSDQVGIMADRLFVLGLTPDTAAVVRLLKDLCQSNNPPAVQLEEEGMSLLLEIFMRTLALKRWNYGKKLLQYLNDNVITENGLRIGRIWKQYNRQEEAQKFIRLYLRAHPESSEAYGMLGELLMKTGSFLEAACYYRQAIEKDPQEPYYYCKLMGLYQEMGEIAGKKDLLYQQRWVSNDSYH